DRGGRWIN
ncbi:D-alanyl-D-alanine carboxypeptidase DacB precursor, partial [Haemophilus influenzae]